MSEMYLKVQGFPRQGFLSVFCVPVVPKRGRTSNKILFFFFKWDSYMFNERLFTTLFVWRLDKWLNFFPLMWLTYISYLWSLVYTVHVSVLCLCHWTQYRAIDGKWKSWRLIRSVKQFILTLKELLKGKVEAERAMRTRWGKGFMSSWLRWEWAVTSLQICVVQTKQVTAILTGILLHFCKSQSVLNYLPCGPMMWVPLIGIR